MNAARSRLTGRLADTDHVDHFVLLDLSEIRNLDEFEANSGNVGAALFVAWDHLTGVTERHLVLVVERGVLPVGRLQSAGGDVVQLKGTELKTRVLTTGQYPVRKP